MSTMSLVVHVTRETRVLLDGRIEMRVRFPLPAHLPMKISWVMHRGFYSMTLPVDRTLLKIDPVWNSIRNRPNFQQLLSGPEQIGPNK